LRFFQQSMQGFTITWKPSLIPQKIMIASANLA
jgi:hypothetical protein